MADETTKKVFVRLTRDFPAGQSHRRGGLVLGTGPQPVEADVTKEQLEALEADPMVELVSAKEAKKWTDRLGEPEQPSSADLAAAKESGKSRNYTGETGNGEGEGADEAGDEEGGEEPLSAEQLLALSRTELNEKATEAGVEEPEKYQNKQELVEAIEQARADEAGDED